MKTVIAAALGECVHVAGVANFLRLAEAAGWRTVFLGPAVSIERVLAAAREEQADLVGVSYRLTPDTGERLLADFAEAADELHSAGMSGFGQLALVTSDMAEALAQADVIMVVVPSSAHAEIAATVAPHLRDGQIIVLHPGRTCDAIEFDKVLRERHCAARVIVSEAETFIYASRSDGPAQARIFRIKEAVPLAALSATCTRAVLEALKPAYPQYIDGVNVLHTGRAPT